MPNTLRDLLKAAKEEEKDPLHALLYSDEEGFEEMDDADSPALPSTLTVGGGSEEAETGTGDDSEEAEEAYSLSPTFIARDNLKEADDSHPLFRTVDLKEAENSDPSLALPSTVEDGAKDVVDDSLSSALTGGEKSKEALDLDPLVPHRILAVGDDSKEAEDASHLPPSEIGDNLKEARKDCPRPPINFVDGWQDRDNSCSHPPLIVGDDSDEAKDDCSLSLAVSVVESLKEVEYSNPLSPHNVEGDLKEAYNINSFIDLSITEGDGAKDAVNASLSPALTVGNGSKVALDALVLHPIFIVRDELKEVQVALPLHPTWTFRDNLKKGRKARSSPPINIVDDFEESENSYPPPTAEDDLDEAEEDCSLFLAASAVESLKEVEDSKPLSPLNVEDDLKEADNSDPSFDLSITEGDGAKDAVGASLSPALTVGENSKGSLGALVIHPIFVVGDDSKEVGVAFLLPPHLTFEDSSDEEEDASLAAGNSTEQNAPLEKEAEFEEAIPVKNLDGLKDPAEKDSFHGEASLTETGADGFESTETSVSLARSVTPKKLSELPEDGGGKSQDYPDVEKSESIIKFQDSEIVDQGSEKFLDYELEGSAEKLSHSPVFEPAESTGELASLESEKFLDYELERSQVHIHREIATELEEKCQESNNDTGDESKPEKEKESMENKTGRLQSEDNKSDNASLAIKTSLRPCPSVGISLENLDLNSVSFSIRSSGGYPGADNCSIVEEAWDKLRKSYVYYKGKPVGTLAAMDPNAEALNYNQVFVRDFVPSGLACLMQKNPEPEIVKNFLLKTLHLQGWEKRVDNFTLGEGVMPASFKVLHDSHCQKETLIADFGGSAIGRVAPVDSGFWWIILLRSYTKCTHDYTLAERPEVQRGMKLILNLCLSDGFDTFPTLLCADGCSMIDRRMGIYGYPIEIQALFYFALRCASQMLKPEKDGKELIERIEKRITALSYHIQSYFWLDFTQLNNVYRYKTEEYSHTAVNKFNVIPDSIPDWVFDFMPLRGGYFIGNVSPARMDFRWFLVGNCIAILSSLATPAQATAIMDLIEERWENLIGEMPLKIVYPALEGHEWRTVTGFDPKNTRWSYQNGGSWPVLLWLLTAACIKTGRPQIAKRAIEQIEQRLSKDGWPEYYDGKTGRYVGKQARKLQTWSISGYLVAKMMIENPCNLLLISLEEDKKTNKSRLTRSTSF